MLTKAKPSRQLTQYDMARVWLDIKEAGESVTLLTPTELLRMGKPPYTQPYLRLRVPKCLHTLSTLWWKKEILRIPLLRRIKKIPYGVRVYLTEPIRYNTSNIFLKKLGKDAGFDMSIDYYAFRR